jgi:hypothetical protein
MTTDGPGRNSTRSSITADSRQTAHAPAFHSRWFATPRRSTDTAEDADYVVFESSRFRTPYVAVKVRPNLELNLVLEYLIERQTAYGISNFF